ncbi:MAG: 3-isopropylmalate dehydrogenase [Proteobacteria bacterium]|nr:3-isopropylmalate dehydrogenase [Pseudomonadota bacterium]
MKNLSKKIAIIEGDGIGPEIMSEAKKLMQLLIPEYELISVDLGGKAIDKYNNPFPIESQEKIKDVAAVLMSAIGAPQYDNLARELRPETGLLGLRKFLGAFANIRPAFVYPALADLSSLKSEIVSGVDLVVVRELTGGIYFGKPAMNDGNRALNTMVYEKYEIERIAKVAFEFAMKRGKRLCSVDKSNVLDVSQLWRDTVIEVSKAYPEVELSHMYVDNAAMQLVRNPKQFDVIVTSNLFGDILSDEASMLTGSIGLLPSASLGGEIGLYEPVHGSAPDIMGKGLANPIAMILSLSMMLRYSLDKEKEASIIDKAVEEVITEGLLTPDLGGKANTTEIGSAIYVKCEQSLKKSLFASSPLNYN